MSESERDGAETLYRKMLTAERLWASLLEATFGENLAAHHFNEDDSMQPPEVREAKAKWRAARGAWLEWHEGGKRRGNDAYRLRDAAPDLAAVLERYLKWEMDAAPYSSSPMAEDARAALRKAGRLP